MEGILEGLLYVSGDDGLTLKQVMSILSLNEEEAKNLVYRLKRNYEEEDRGLRLNYLGNTHTLSQAALEVLAIIAYNEPVTRGQVDEMRGVDSIFVLRKLLAKGLIKESGRSNLPGHPILYKTTDDFLDYFGLSTKEDLPDISITIDDSEEKDLFQSNYHEEKE